MRRYDHCSQLRLLWDILLWLKKVDDVNPTDLDPKTRSVIWGVRVFKNSIHSDLFSCLRRHSCASPATRWVPGPSGNWWSCTRKVLRLGRRRWTKDWRRIKKETIQVIQVTRGDDVRNSNQWWVNLLPISSGWSQQTKYDYTWLYIKWHSGNHIWQWTIAIV